jgi:hypothetical protein
METMAYLETPKLGARERMHGGHTILDAGKVEPAMGQIDLLPAKRACVFARALCAVDCATELFRSANCRSFQ